MNFINLLNLIKNQIDNSTFQTLRDDFLDDYATEYKNLRPCKSVSDKAIKKYISGAKIKDEKTATYTTGKTVLLLNKPIPEAESKDLQTKNIAPQIIEMWQDKKPTSCFFMDSIALYKTLKKQEKTDYFLHIDGHYYNAALIAEMVECIATNKDTYIQADICKNGALFIRQNGNGALILPVVRNGCPEAQNVNMQDFLLFVDRIEKKLLDDIKRTA